MTKKQKEQCTHILKWYKKEGRDLPWRHTHDPYKILISEVMLQQTQVSRVVEKYKEFVRLFPNAKRLAEAKTADIIFAWKGLGYNRRALYLQKTVEAVRTTYKGRFPKELQTLKSLPGIGDYTARAIRSFAFDMPTPVLDTNHRKFYQKTFFGDALQSDSDLLDVAEDVIAYIGTLRMTFPGTESLVWHWNQALMDWVSAHGEQYLLPKKRTTKKSLPFSQTDRFVRGKIIDYLREKNTLPLSKLAVLFPAFTKDRLATIVSNLEKDQLILVKKESIVLP